MRSSPSTQHEAAGEAGGVLEQFACARMLAELGHDDAAQGQRRRVAQGDELEGAEASPAARARAEAAIRESMARAYTYRD